MNSKLTLPSYTLMSQGAVVKKGARPAPYLEMVGHKVKPRPEPWRPSPHPQVAQHVGGQVLCSKFTSRPHSKCWPDC